MISYYSHITQSHPHMIFKSHGNMAFSRIKILTTFTELFIEFYKIATKNNKLEKFEKGRTYKEIP